jgi:hypothetical protein
LSARCSGGIDNQIILGTIGVACQGLAARAGVRCVDDEDVVGTGVFDQVTYRVVSAGSPVTPICPKLLSDRQIT